MGFWKDQAQFDIDKSGPSTTNRSHRLSVTANNTPLSFPISTHDSSLRVSKFFQRRFSPSSLSPPVTSPDRPPSMASSDAEYRCFVGGLAWATDDSSLEKAFSQYGEIIDSKVYLISSDS